MDKLLKPLKAKKSQRHHNSSALSARVHHDGGPANQSVDVESTEIDELFQQ